MSSRIVDFSFRRKAALHEDPLFAGDPAKYAVWDDKDNYHKHFEQMGSFETGHACERLTDVILTHTMTPRKNSGGKHHDKK